jgi:hypothetical protein
MILGLSVAAFTLAHVALSLVGMAAGAVVLAGMLAGRRLPGWTAIFLLTMAATSLTGYPFPAQGFDPARVVGLISLVALGVAALALYAGKLSGLWRPAFVIGATFALYLDVFVGVVQAFAKIAPLKRLAPTQTEPPFAIAQLATLALFVVLGVFAVRRFHPGRA